MIRSFCSDQNDYLFNFEEIRSVIVKITYSNSIPGRIRSVSVRITYFNLIPVSI